MHTICKSFFINSFTDEPRKFNNEINIQNYFTDELKEISEELRKLRCEFEGFRSEAAWRRTHKHAANITLAVASAHPNLSIAVDKKSFTVKAPHLLVSPNPQRFDGILSVLGSQGFSSGQHYWAVDVSSSTEWDLGVARESIKRKGEISLSPKEGFWVLGLCGKDFWAKTDPWTRVTVQRKPTKIGVFLNFLENEITFFNGTDRSVLFAFKDCLFLEDIYPFFKNTHKGTTIRICSIK
ncbi:putative butyrophilin subfamily 2 member A3 [Hemicordylus capensis]|uniref:putative butyrophilin subfamily 2 member A3 n=1 Tax=Hemicordylus capensis TaxID=884348 RepID=UPI002302C507|nr:putative butyrophilin subfamily 2 member A3 [Hemicordylus capensis]